MTEGVKSGSEDEKFDGSGWLKDTKFLRTRRIRKIAPYLETGRPMVFSFEVRNIAFSSGGEDLLRIERIYTTMA